MKIEYMKDSKIISIAPIRAQMRFPALQQVEGYWEGLRDGRQMPTRGEVDPRGISEVLEYAFILEKIAPRMARIRLAGMHLNDLMGMEVRGMPITAMFLPEARRDFQTLLGQVLDTPATVKATLTSDHGFARPKLEAQMILLPLKDDQGRTTRVLGCLQAKGTIGRGPRRFKIQSQEVKTLPADARPVYTRPVYSGPSEAPAVPRPTGTPPHLRLVHDTPSAEE